VDPSESSAILETGSSRSTADDGVGAKVLPGRMDQKHTSFNSNKNVYSIHIIYTAM
jgi:hypothetical protein